MATRAPVRARPLKALQKAVPGKGSGVVVPMARVVGMPGPTAGSAVPVGRARTLAQVYRHFGEVDAAETSPL